MLCVMGSTRLVECMQEDVGVTSSIGRKSEKLSLMVRCSISGEVVVADRETEIDHDRAK